MRAGEGALLVAEQFAFQQSGRQGGAMHCHHRLPGPRTELMNGFGDEFLARAAFAQDQHRGGPGLGHLPHFFQDLLHRGRFADDVLQAEPGLQLHPQGGVFLLQGLAAQRPGDAHLHLLDLQSALGNVVVGPAFHGLHREFFGAVSGHEDAHRGLGQGFGPGDQLHAILVGQAEIGQDHVKTLLFQQVHPGGGVLRHINVVPILQSRPQALPRGLLVIDDEQHRFRHLPSSGWPARQSCRAWSNLVTRSYKGSQMRKTVPFPTWLSRSILPPCARTMRCTIIKPSPVPFFFVV